MDPISISEECRATLLFCRRISSQPIKISRSAFGCGWQIQTHPSFIGEYWSGGANDGWILGCDDAGTGKVKFFTGGAAPQTTLSAGTLSARTWHHVAATYSNTVPYPVKIYIDGSLDSTANMVQPGYSGSTYSAVGGVALNASSATEPTQGMIDAVAVYGYVLPASGGSYDSVAGIYGDPFRAVRPPGTLALSGPSAGITGTISSNFSVAATSLGYSDTVTCHSDSGGSFTTSPLSFSSGSSSQTFTYTPAADGTHSISITDTLGATISGSPISYVSTPHQHQHRHQRLHQRLHRLPHQRLHQLLHHTNANTDSQPNLRLVRGGWPICGADRHRHGLDR